MDPGSGQLNGEVAATLISELRDFAVVALDSGGKIVSWNKGAELITGYSVQDCLGKPLNIIHQKQDQQVLMQLLAETSRTRRALDQRWCLRKDGSVFWADTVLAVLHTTDENTGRYLAIIRDLTDRRNAEQQTIQQAELRFEKIFRLGPAPMAISRFSDGTFVDMNDMYVEYFGYSRYEMIGRTSRDLQIISDSERASLVETLKANGSARGVSLHTHTRSGEPRDVLFSSEIVDLGGEPLMLSILYDVTERRQAELALLQSKTELLEAQEIAKLGVWTLDIATGLAQWSVTFAKIHGRGPEWRSAALREYLQLVVPEDRSDIEGYIQTLLATGKSRTFDYRVLTPDGDSRWMNVRMDLVRDADGKPIQVRGISQDVSHRIRLEAQLRQSQKLDAIGQLAGGIAHDLNNILGVVFGHLSMAADDLPGKHPVHVNLEAIKKASRRGADLVRRILSVSSPRPPLGRLINVRAILDETLGLLRASLPAMITIRPELEPSTPPIKADGTQLHQVLMNLATNAGHSMESRTDGILTIELRTVRIDTDTAAISPDLREGTYVRISISDNGHGMDRQTMERIFEPFFTTKQTGKGTGLGLSIVHGIIRGHGGAITVYSEVNKGTTFRVYFPVAASEAPIVPETRAEDMSSGQGQAILCVDDETELLDINSAMLARMGYAVTKHSDPYKALGAFEAAPDYFQLVLLDQAMPGLTGIRLAERLLALRPGLPIVLLSGNFTDKDIADTARLGLRRLGKPATREELNLLMREMLP